MSPRAMEHIRSDGTVVYLKVPFGEIEKRLGNLSGRGVVFFAGQTLHGMYAERVVLYESYADITIDCDKLNFEAVVAKILSYPAIVQTPRSKEETHPVYPPPGNG